LDDDQITILSLVLLIHTIVVGVAIVAARKNMRAPADDIGVMWLVVLALYSTLSPITWVLHGGTYSIFSFSRLFTLQPTTQEMIELLQIAVAYTIAFALVYLGFRWSSPIRRTAEHYPYISASKIGGALTIVVVFQIALLIVSIGGFIRAPESYTDTYKIIQELPLGLRQGLKVGQGIASVGMLVLLVGILQRWPRQRFLFVLYILVVLLSFDARGSRSAIATGLLAAGIAWHVLVREIPVRWWISSGVAGLLIFTALGVFRALESWEEFGTIDFEGAGIGEFDALWANGVELLQAKQAQQLDMPLAARFGEFWAFVPSQLLFFEKWSAADWFVGTFHPDDQAIGGGWAFGAIGQAVIGDGVYEAAIRGGILGALAAWIMKWYQSTQVKWWALPVYLYLLVFVYQSVRDTTFQPLGGVVQIVLPALLLIEVFGTLLDFGRHSPRPIDSCQRSCT
jgi:hypothetical protein